MTEPKTILAELIERRDRIFEELREREPERVASWLQLNAAISGIEAESVRTPKRDEYAGFRRPSEALIAYLEKMGKPQDKEAMCQALVDGGYGHGTSRPYWDLIRAIDYQIDRSNPILVETNGLIGKKEWSKAMFVKEK